MQQKFLNRSLVIFSGGLDSTVCLYLALKESSHVEAISFDYGQRHKIELEKAKKHAKLLNVPHTVINLSKKIFLNSSLVDTNMEVKKNSISKKSIPTTYVPGRNILFLSYAVSFAEGRDLDSIYLGVNALDYSGYPDCRPNFIRAFQKVIQLGTKTGVTGKKMTIRTPLLKKTKKEIILLGKKLEVPFSKTHSCYDPVAGKACGSCESCILRRKGFEQAGVNDE